MNVRQPTLEEDRQTKTIGNKKPMARNSDPSAKRSVSNS